MISVSKSTGDLLRSTMMTIIRRGFNTIATIPLIIIENNSERKIMAKEGETLLDVCKRNDVQIIGACEGNCACSTCHLILEERIYKNLPSPSEAEEDMLDMAYGLTTTSRLACQVRITKLFEGTKIRVLEKQRNITIETIGKDLKL